MGCITWTEIELSFRYVVFDSVSFVHTHLKSILYEAKKVCLLSLAEKKYGRSVGFIYLFILKFN